MLATTAPPAHDALPAFCTARVLILGIGNVLFGDDGFGPAVIESLLGSYDIPNWLCLMDVGTGARKLLFTLALSDTHPQEIIIADTVGWGQKIGNVTEIDAADLPATKIDDFSLHQIPTSNMLRELQEIRGISVSVVVCDIGRVPEMIETGLSPAIRQAVTDACQLIAGRFGLRLLAA